MKVTTIKTYRMWAGTRNWLFVKVETDSGLYGWGEGSLEWWDEVVESAIKTLSRLVIGRDPLERRAIHFDLYRRYSWSGGAILGSAISAIDLALWDLAGKIHDVPVYQLLGGAQRTQMRAYLSGGYLFSTPDEAIELAQKWGARGFTAMKANPAEKRRTPLDYQAIEETVAILAALREAVGWEIDLLLDCHGSPTPPFAIQLAQAIAPYRPMFLEEPTQDGDIGALREVARQSVIPIAGGEKLTSIHAFREVCEQKAATILQPDVLHVGGITGLLRIAEMLESYQVWVAPHNATGPIGAVASLHVDAVIPNFLIQEIGAYVFPYYEDILKTPIRLENGYFHLTDTPGLGIELDEDAFAKHPPRPMTLRDYRHADGSWSGW
jgi:galactonate dehydratase